MNAVKEIETALKNLRENSRETSARLGTLAEKLGIRFDSRRWQDEVDSEIISQTGVFTPDESDAIVFVLAETGKGLDEVEHFMCFGW